MLLEILKVLLGVAAGAFLNEWLRRRSARVQTIPLIQRVNRLVNFDLQELPWRESWMTGGSRR